MALKSSTNNGSPNKNNENNSKGNQEKSSQSVPETGKKQKPKKKNNKHKLTYRIQPYTAMSNHNRRVANNLPLVPMMPGIMPVSTIANYYPQYANPGINYVVPDWNTIPMHVQNPIYNVSYPVPFVLTQQVVRPLICPYTGTIMPQPMIPPISQPMVVEELPAYNYDNNATFSPEQRVPAGDNYQRREENVNLETLYELEGNPNADLQNYLTLPRDLFPTARMLSLNPNPIIDEICKMAELDNNVPWLLDLEFGVPRLPVSRPIPTYDVKYNSIHCRNTPNAIHPGFESCSQEFKAVLLFYYDCIISSWYRGYTHFNYDCSVENFQSWMQLPMQVLGMCWP